MPLFAGLRKKYIDKNGYVKPFFMKSEKTEKFFLKKLKFLSTLPIYITEAREIGKKLRTPRARCPGRSLTA